jgi:hypothetical protein
MPTRGRTDPLRRTGKASGLELRVCKPPVVPQILVRAHGNARAHGDGSFRTDEFEASAWHEEFWCDSALTPRLESASGHGNRGRELDAVDFGSKKQGWIANATLSSSRRTR